MPLSFEADVLLLDVPGAQFEGDLGELLALGAEIHPILSQGEVGVSLKKQNKKNKLCLAHLSRRRLTGELIGYLWIRRPSSSSVHIFKHPLL